MTILGMSAASECLKLFYLDGLRYQLNEESSAFLAQLERDEESVVGGDITMALRYGRVGGIGNRSDVGTLPTPSSRKTKQAKWATRNIFARFQISDKAVRATKSSVGAFTSMLEQEIADCETDVKQDMSRQVLGDGNGSITSIVSATYTTGKLALVVADASLIAEGMILDIIDNDTVDIVLTGGSALEVVSVIETDASQIVTLACATDISATVAAGDYLVVSGNLGLEVTGVKGVFENTSLYGLLRSDYPFLNAQRKDISGEISEIAIQKAIDDANKRAGAIIDFIMCSLGVRRGFQNLLAARKTTVNTIELKGGFKAVDFNGIPLYADKYVGAGKMDLLSKGDWKLYQLADYDWLDSDGAILSRVSNTPVWEATLVKYCDLGCQRPRGQYELYNIAEH